MHKCILLLASLLSLGFSSMAADALASPQKEDVQAWWKLHSTEELTVNEQPMPVYLRSQELAYLVSVSFSQRSINDVKQVLIIRPALQEVREAGEAVHDDYLVLDIDGDGVSEVMGLATRYGKGTVAGTRSIVQFDDWTPEVLHQAAFDDNLGVCGHGAASPKCIENSVEWIFSDLNNDGFDELIERLEKNTGPSAEHLHVVRSKTVAYLFKKDRFVKAGKALNKKAKAIG